MAREPPRGPQLGQRFRPLSRAVGGDAAGFAYDADPRGKPTRCECVLVAAISIVRRRSGDEKSGDRLSEVCRERPKFRASRRIQLIGGNARRNNGKPRNCPVAISAFGRLPVTVPYRAPSTKGTSLPSRGTVTVTRGLA
jgi:hypothetical protein